MWTGEEPQDGRRSTSTTEQANSVYESYETDAAGAGQRRQPSPKNGLKAPAQIPGIVRAGDAIAYKNGDSTLPLEKAFSIQIGWRLFRLSGASLLSDAPSYFSAYFEEQMRQIEHGGSPKTLYIDRDPETFADICRHLQGYHTHPRDGEHFVKLYADAQFYSLPRLLSQLFEADIFVTVGSVPFQIPRDAFSGPGNSSNFFTLGFAGFIGSREDAFPGLESRGLMRPPPMQQQTVPNRNPDILRDLINFARGYPINIRDRNHRAALLGDCKYYGFKGLMHRLFAHEISYNAERASTEIVMRIEDLHKSGVSFFPEPNPAEPSPLGGWVHYARPFVDESSFEVIVEIASQETKIDLRSMRAEFYGDTKARIASLFQTVADKMNLPSNLPLGLMMSSGGASAAPASPANTPLSEDRVKIHIGSDAFILLDGAEHQLDPFSYASSGQSEHEDWNTGSYTTPQPQSPFSRMSPRQPQPPPTKKRKRRGSLDEFGEWIVKKAQWRLRVQPKQVAPMPESQMGMGPRRGAGALGDGVAMEIVLWAVKLEAFSGQRGKNMKREWVS